MTPFGFSKPLPFLIALAWVLTSCGDSTNEPPREYTAADLEGEWFGVVTIVSGDDSGAQTVVGFRFDSLGAPTAIFGRDQTFDCTGSMEVSGSGAITGTMVLGDGTAARAEVSYDIAGQFVSKTEVQLNGTTDSPESFGDFEVSLTKDRFAHIDVTLNRWADSEGTWWLNIRVYALGATRVYATGTHIVGEYDLFKCGSLGAMDYWWSSNHTNCDIGDNNYSFHYVPQLPFDIEIHVVTSAGDEAHTVTIRDYHLVTKDDYSVYELFPVTLNSSWTYDDGTTVTVTSVTDVEGRRYATITNNDGSGHLELVLSSSEVTFGSSSPNPDHIIAANYFAQNPLLKVPLNLNVTWNGDLLSNGYLVNFDCEVVSNTETVTIGGTVYSNCTEVTVDFSYPEGYDWPEWIVNRKLYFHSGVGCIRRVDTWTDSSITTMEVVAYDMR